MKVLFSTFFLAIPLCLFAQGIIVEGYAYESDNRGYLNEVKIQAKDLNDGASTAETFTNLEGYFKLDLPPGAYELIITKNLFREQVLQLSDASTVTGNKYFFKVTLKRKPGYLFDITLANKRDSNNTAVDAIHDSRIEVYNNTTEELEYSNLSYGPPNFLYTLTKGNRYTIMIRKEGYLAKRIEAKVDVEGCILCIDGLSKLSPGVTDNLTEGHEMGTLLANIEMEPADVGTKFKIENIYYETSKFKLTTESKSELKKVIQLMRDNPLIEIEIGSHTDSRGKDDLNLKLSQNRANEVVEFLIDYGSIAADRMRARGFGDTQLVNHCKDGVTCSELEHAENRRTELRITGIRKSATADKSLLEIKELEKMEKLIEELQNQEVIEVREGDELPDEIKKEIEKGKSKKRKKDNQ